MLKLVTDATVEPLTTAEAKSHLKISNSADDAYIAAMIKGVRRFVENYLNRVLINQTWQLWLDRSAGIRAPKSGPWFDGMRTGYIGDLVSANSFIDLKMPNVSSISSFTWYDMSNVSAAYDHATNTFLDSKSEPCRLCFNLGSILPTNARTYNAFVIEFIVGYGAASTNVPEDIIQAIRQTMAHLYVNRGDQMEQITLPPSARLLLDPYRVMRMQ